MACLDEAKSTEMEARMSTRALVLQTLRWCQLHGVEWEFVLHMLIFVACCVVLSGAPAQSVANAILWYMKRLPTPQRQPPRQLRPRQTPAVNAQRFELLPAP